MESSHPERIPAARKLSTEEVQDAHIGLLEWELEERDRLQGVDHLTGTATRKVFEEVLGKSLKKKREGEKEQEISLISIDLDHFKQINDTLGHPAGDEVLRRVSALLMESVRESDMVARVGGEELMILLQGADKSFAAHLAEELRTKIEHIPFDEHPGLKVTASIGVISSDVSADMNTLVRLVDGALYAAKNTGRNKVVTYDEA